ncbi:MAG: SoxR reducing system RseC family protein [Clostridia bacterium]|nr:SoxR reducing system RseC family protein [Clostridia bacterium]
MRKAGIVKVGGEWAKVNIVRASACGENCAMCKGGCAPSETEILAKNPMGAKSGDKVILEIPDKIGLWAVFLAYVLPLLALLVVGGILLARNAHEIIAFLAGICAMAGVFFIVRKATGDKMGKFSAEIVKILSNCDPRI